MHLNSNLFELGIEKEIEKETNPNPIPEAHQLNPAPPLFSLSPRPSKRTSPAWPNPHARVPLHTSAQLAPACSRSPASFAPQPSQRGPRKPPRHPARPAPKSAPRPDKPAPLVSAPPRLPFFNLQPRSPPEDVVGHPYRVRTPRSPEPPLISHPADPCTFILTPKAAQTLARRSVTPSPRRALRRRASGAPPLRSQPEPPQ